MRARLLTPQPPAQGGLACARVLVLWVSLVLAGCASGPSSTRSAGSAPRGADGPPDRVSPDPLSVPDALPRVEPIRMGGPNKPYEVAGQTYVPMTQDAPLVETGMASWYGSKFHGRRTASGELYNMHAMTAAHKTMPLPSFARVRNPANGREIVVRVNDRGPFVAGRVIDLSYAAAMKLGVPSLGRVEVIRLTHDDIRAMGRSDEAATALAAAPPTTARPVALAAAPPPAATPPAAAPPLQALPPPTQPPPTQPSTAPPTTEAQAVAAPGAMDLSGHPEMPGASPGGVPLRAYTQTAGGFWLQLGAFGRSEGALGFHRRISQDQGWLAPLLAVFVDGRIHRLQAGPYASRQLAQEAAERVQSALQLVPLVIERR